MGVFHYKDKDKDKDLFISSQEFVVGYSKAPECHTQEHMNWNKSMHSCGHI